MQNNYAQNNMTPSMLTQSSPRRPMEPEMPPRDQAIQKIYKMLENQDGGDYTDTAVEARWGKAEQIYDSQKQPQMQQQGMLSPEGQQQGRPQGIQKYLQIAQMLSKSPTKETAGKIIQVLQTSKDQMDIKFAEVLKETGGDPKEIAALAEEMLQDSSQ